MKLNISILGQRDPRWSSKKLGNSTVSIIGDYGCALVCMTMLCQYYGKNIDVGQLNDELKKVKGFDGTYLVWQAVNTTYSDIKFTAFNDYPLESAPVNSIQKQIEEGKPVVLWVDINPNQLGNQQHFVLVTGTEGQDFVIHDPWYCDEILFSTRYGDPAKGILGHRFFSGPVPMIPDNNELTVCLAEKKRISDELKETNTELESANSQVIGYQDNLKAIASNLSSVDNNVLPDVTSIQGAILKLKNEEDQLRQVKKKNEDLEKAIVECNRLFDELNKTHQLSVEELKAVKEAFHGLTDEKKELERKNNFLSAQYEEILDNQKYIYKHLIFGLYVREVKK